MRFAATDGLRLAASGLRRKTTPEVIGDANHALRHFRLDQFFKIALLCRRVISVKGCLIFSSECWTFDLQSALDFHILLFLFSFPQLISHLLIGNTLFIGCDTTKGPSI